MKKLLLLIMTTLIITSIWYVAQANNTQINNENKVVSVKKLTPLQKRLLLIRLKRLKAIQNKVTTGSVLTWNTSTWVICTWVDIIQKIDLLTWTAEYVYNTMIDYNSLAKDVYIKYQWDQNCYEYSKIISSKLHDYTKKIEKYKKDYIYYLWRELYKVDTIIMDKQKTIFDESQTYKQCMYNNNIYNKNIDCGIDPEEYLQSMKDKSNTLFKEFQRVSTNK